MMDIFSLMKAKRAADATAAKIATAMGDYLEEHPQALNQAAVETLVQDRLDAVESRDRVTSLNTTVLARGNLIEAVGALPYVRETDPEYAAYSLTEKGWYVFSRVAAKHGVTVTGGTSIQGAAGYIAVIGAGYVDVAVRFDTTAQSVPVVIDWGAYVDAFVFKASDLGMRNLDYRTTFYIYDVARYVHWTYALATDAKFVADKNYYTKDGDSYTLAQVTVGQDVPANTYYNHSKLRFEGMVPNVTYRLDEVVDCPLEIALPEIAEDGHGAWFEIQMRYNGSYSCILLPPTGVKIGTATTQAQSAGINTIDLQYTDVNGVKMWTLLNTHSNIPA